MPMSEADKKELKEGMLEIYEELFSTDIEFLPYDKDNNHPDSDVYAEQKYKNFLAPIKLTGRVRMTTEDELLTPIGVSQDDVDITFTVPVLSLEKGQIFGFGEDTIKKSRIRYQNTTYEIVDFQPESNIADIFFKYAIKCKKVTR